MPAPPLAIVGRGSPRRWAPPGGARSRSTWAGRVLRTRAVLRGGVRGRAGPSRWAALLRRARHRVDAVLLSQRCHHRLRVQLVLLPGRVPGPRDGRFLISIMPLKRIDELYNAIGKQPGRPSCSRNLMTTSSPPGRFDSPRGAGMVMGCSTLRPSVLVFKISGQLRAPQEHHPSPLAKYLSCSCGTRVGRWRTRMRSRPGLPRRCFPTSCGVPASGQPPPVLCERPGDRPHSTPSGG